MVFGTLARTGYSIGCRCRISTHLPIGIAGRQPTVACPAGVRGFRSSTPLFDKVPRRSQPSLLKRALSSLLDRTMIGVAKQLLALAKRKKIPWVRDADFLPHAERAFVAYHAVFTERNPELLGVGLTAGGLRHPRQSGHSRQHPGCAPGSVCVCKRGGRSRC
eukprot:TRINITY_DN4747_c0_g1_i1.p1 TRINITY_DN4747_c0_g1~~TRINITY_DN4747_c0_g1_i1.p1  ORF type:complete len:162 (-),score=0.02 TRINITY_DN4747_c0_g1_i1:35-520(-)